MISECASQSSVNMEWYNYKYKPNGAHHKTVNIHDETNSDSLLDINLNINELQEFWKIAFGPHAREVMSALITKVVHKFAAIKYKCLWKF
jgi:hypothetical protein